MSALSEPQTTPVKQPSTSHLGGNGDHSGLSELALPPRPPRLAFSVRETAEALGVSEKTIRRLIDRQLLNPSRALRHLLISKKEVERFLEETTT